MRAALQSDGTHFDAIHVGAAAATLPKQVCDLLAKDGLMMVPVGPRGGAQVRCPVAPEPLARGRHASLRFQPCGWPRPGIKGRAIAAAHQHHAPALQVLSVVKKTVDENGEESLEISKCGQVQYVPLTTPDMDMSAV